MHDITHAHNPEGKWTHQHLMAVNEEFADITRADVMTVADRFSIGTAPKILQQVADAIAAWPDFAAQSALSKHELERVLAHHRLRLA